MIRFVIKRHLITLLLLLSLPVLAQIQPGGVGGGGGGGGGSATNAVTTISINGSSISTTATWLDFTNSSGYVTGNKVFINPTGSGEVNVNGEVSVTNATRIGLVHGKAGVTNRLRSISGGNGIVVTNQGTNIPIAIDPAVVASQANVTTLSNALVTYADGITNSSIARQAEMTALSNALVQYTIDASNIVRLVAGLDATNHAAAILQSATNYADSVSGGGGGSSNYTTLASGSLTAGSVLATNNVTVGDGTSPGTLRIAGTNLSGASITAAITASNAVNAASNTAHSTAIMLSGKNTATAGTTNQIQSEGAWVWVPTANTIGSGTHVLMSRTNAGSGNWVTNATLSTANFIATGGVLAGNGSYGTSAAGGISGTSLGITGNAGIGMASAPSTERLKVVNSTAALVAMWVDTSGTNYNARWSQGSNTTMQLGTNGNLFLAGGLQTRSGYAVGNSATAQIDFQSTNSALYVTNLANNIILNLTNLIHRKDCWVDIGTDGTQRTVTIGTNYISNYRVAWGFNAGNTSTNSIIVTNACRINIATTRPGIIAVAVEHQNIGTP